VSVSRRSARADGEFLKHLKHPCLAALSALPLAYPTDETWALMDEWTDRAVRGGAAFGVGDLLIAAIAHEADALIWSLDQAFTQLQRLRLARLY